MPRLCRAANGSSRWRSGLSELVLKDLSRGALKPDRCRRTDGLSKSSSGSQRATRMSDGQPIPFPQRVGAPVSSDEELACGLPARCSPSSTPLGL